MTASESRVVTRLAPLAFNLWLAFVALVLFVGVAEIGARIFYKMRWGQLYPLQSMEYSLRLGWRLAPGQHRDFTVNSAGFRGETEVSLRAEPGTLRIFLVGGSAAFGSNGLYAQFPAEPIREETIDYHLQRLLEEQYPGRSIEVINAAVPEYRLNQEITLYSEKLLNYSPDLVIFFDGHNDISYLSGVDVDTAVAGLWNARHIRRGERALNARSVFNLSLILDIYLGRSSYAYHMLATVMQKLADRRGVSGEHPWGARPFTLADEAALASTAPHLDSAAVKYVDQIRYLAAMASHRDRSIVYALQPQIVDEDSMHLTALERRIQAFAFEHHRDRGTFAWRYLGARLPAWLEPVRSDRFAVVDLSRIATGDEATTLYSDYTHLTAAGNRRVAELLMPHVVRMLEQGPSVTDN